MVKGILKNPNLSVSDQFGGVKKVGCLQSETLAKQKVTNNSYMPSVMQNFKP